MASTCQSAEIDGRKVSVIDTPGLFSTSMDEVKVKDEFDKCILRSVPGPHAFLLVVRLGRFTQDEKSAVRWIQKHFGEDTSRYTLVLFTGADQIMKKSLDEFLSPSKEIQDLIDYCGGRYHAFNNEDEQNLTQVPELLQKIEKMVMKNRGKHYTNEMYKEAERKMKEEEERRKTAEEWEATKENL
ncbi:GTPase IMAP family member 9-like [Conger conger]|uniref:GTPase IMAP family member 9-like n=1 Tax=Conger conger TaxID=82655 RepID=UPI002A5A5901|nr:GTPase IMAP family member 9-like [Conger conger]